MSRDCCVALPRGATGLQFVIVVFPDHTHLLFYKLHSLFAILLQIAVTLSISSSNILCWQFVTFVISFDY